MTIECLWGGMIDMSKVLVVLAQGCEELEAITVIDLLRRAEIKVITASLSDKVVVASRGTAIIADVNIDEVLDDEFDMIVLPGGLPGADNLNDDLRIKQKLLNMAKENKYIAAICAAPKVLANHGLLDNRKATGFPGVLDHLQIDGFEYSAKPVVQDGKIITSRGPGTAMDFALHLIEVLTSKDTRNRVEYGLQREKFIS